MTSIVSTYARKSTTCGLLINGFHAFSILGFFLTIWTRISTAKTCSTRAIKWQILFYITNAFKTWLYLYILSLASPCP